MLKKIDARRRGNTHYGIRDTAYLRLVSKKERLSPTEEALLAKQVKLGDQQARGRLIYANLLFVPAAVKNFQGMGISMSDLIGFGNEALIKAVDRFDETKGFKLISYAVWWIRQIILLELCKSGRMIEIPINKFQVSDRAKKAAIRYLQRHECDPSREKIAEELGVKPSVILENFLDTQQHFSLNQPLTDGGKMSFEEIQIENSSLGKPDKLLIKESFATDLTEALSELTDREKDIIISHYLEEQCIRTIAEKYKVTCARINNLKSTALEKIRVSKKATDLLREYL